MRAIHLLLVSVSLLMLTGCGNNTQQSSVLKVSNLTAEEKVAPDPQFDPKELANASAYLASLTVVDENGNKLKLNHSTRPVLFEAYWCPHCQRTLVLFHKTAPIMKQAPLVISTGFPQGTTLPEAVTASKREFALLGLSGFTVYYALGNVQVPTYPTLLFHQNQSVNLLLGEHTKDIWEEAIVDPTR